MSEAKPTPGECRCTPRAVDESGNWASRIPFAIEIAVGAAVIPVADVCAQPQAEANAALITEAFNVHNTTGLTPSQLVERVKELEAVLVRWLGPADDPNVGWRGTRGTDVLFACEHCHATSEDCTKIEHADDCPITLGRAALSKARPNTAEGE